jgi:ABC-2 type transport system permease protein
MFHAALWKLFRLKCRGGFRQAGRSLKTVRGVFQFGFMLAMMGWGFGSMIFFGHMSASTPLGVAGMMDRMRDLATFGIFSFTTWTVLFSTGESMVYFTASEVAFLFPAPFQRRQLLSFKLLQSLSGIVFLSLLMSFTFARSPGLWLAGFLGSILTLAFLQLLTMNVAFLRQVFEARSSVLVRRIIGITVLALLLMAVSQTVMDTPGGDFASLANAFRNSTSGAILLAPFSVFTRMLFPNSLSSFLMSFGTVLALDSCLLAFAYRLDGLSLEAALAISEKMTARMKRAQSKGIWQVFGSPTSQAARRRLPLLPFWNGLGPIIWQRVTTNIRTSLKLFVLLGGATLLAGGLAFSIHRKDPSEPLAALGAAIGVMNYVSILISLSLQNEIERVGYLKSLPLSPRSIVLGELLGFVALISAVQISLYLALCGLLPSVAGWLIFAALLAFPFNFLLFGIDKLVFYVFPTRMAKGAPGDFQNGGKQMVFVFFKMAVLIACLALVGIAIIPGAIMGSNLLAVIPAACVLLAECAGLIPLLGYAFHRFDPGVDMPT